MKQKIQGNAYSGRGPLSYKLDSHIPLKKRREEKTVKKIPSGFMKTAIFAVIRSLM